MVTNKTISLENFKNKKLVQDIMDGFFKRRIETQKQLDYFLYKSFRAGKDIMFNDLKEIEIGNHYDFPTIENFSKITSKRIQIPEKNSILFESMFSKGATLTRHRHSDSCETITSEYSDSPHEFVFTILLGSEKEGNMKEYVLHSGESMIIPSNTPHQISNASKKPAKLMFKFLKECD